MRLDAATQIEPKKYRPIDHEMTTPLFLLRCVQIEIALSELDLLTIGVANDMFTERENGNFDGYTEVASQVVIETFNIIM